MTWNLSGFAKATSRRDGGATDARERDGRRVTRDELAVGNRRTAKRADGQTLLAHAEAWRGRGEMKVA